jgi:hypothetical protein
MSFTRTRILPVAGAVLILATACGSTSTDTSRSSSMSKADSGGVAAKEAPNQPAPGAPAKFAVQSRSIIFTGTVTVRVTNVDDAADQAGDKATGAGGFVGGDDRSDDRGRRQARLTLRVPSERFTTVVDQVAGLGKAQSRKLSSEDVTDQVVDLDSRINTGQASVNRVRDLMGRTGSISEIVSLEAELSRREADLESLKARKARLDDQTALSTITAVLIGPPPAATAAKPATGFLAGLSAGWSAFLASMNVLLTVVGAVLPWVALVGVPAALIGLYLRRTRRRAPEPAA